MSMPPGEEQPVSISGAQASAASDKDFKGSPCGVVNEDPYQAKLVLGEPSLQKPGAVPISAYCQEPTLIRQKTFLEQVYRFTESSAESLSGARAYNFSGNTITRLPPSQSTSSQATSATQHVHYSSNKRLFFQTVLKYATTVDFVCQCRQGLIPAFIVWSGALNLKYSYSSAETDLAESRVPWFSVIKDVLQLLHTSGNTFAGLEDFTQATSESGKILACPVVTLVRFTNMMWEKLKSGVILPSSISYPNPQTNESVTSKNVWTQPGYTYSEKTMESRKAALAMITSLRQNGGISASTFVDKAKEVLTQEILQSTDCSLGDFGYSFVQLAEKPDAPTPSPTHAPTPVACKDRKFQKNILESNQDQYTFDDKDKITDADDFLFISNYKQNSGRFAMVGGQKLDVSACEENRGGPDKGPCDSKGSVLFEASFWGCGHMFPGPNNEVCATYVKTDDNCYGHDSGRCYKQWSCCTISGGNNEQGSIQCPNSAGL